jgi:hypothetical protein
MGDWKVKLIGKVVATRPSAPPKDAATIEVREIVVRDAPDARQVFLINGGQSFMVGDYWEDPEDAEMYAKCLRHAITTPATRADRLDAIFDLTPQLASVDCGPEPSLRHIVFSYYAGSGMAADIAEKYTLEYVAAIARDAHNARKGEDHG